MRTPAMNLRAARARRGLPRVALGALLASVLSGAAGPALAQDSGGPSPQEIQEKIREIERLMKVAEGALARSTGTAATSSAAEDARRKLEELIDRRAQAETGRSAEKLRSEAAGGSAEAAEALRRITEAARSEAATSAHDSAARIDELLRQRAQQQTGKSADELRREAESGSAEAAETLRRLMEEAKSEAQRAAEAIDEVLRSGGQAAGGAGDGIRKLLDETQSSGDQVRAGIEWLLENAVSQGSSGGGGGQQHQQREKEPQSPKEDEPKDDPAKRDPTPPQNERDPPNTPPDEQWIMSLPDEQRKAYESRDWDAIPPRWRAIMRAWTIKMATDLEEGTRR